MRCDENLSDRYVIFCNVIKLDTTLLRLKMQITSLETNLISMQNCAVMMNCVAPLPVFLLNGNKLTEANFDNYFAAFTA